MVAIMRPRGFPDGGAFARWKSPRVEEMLGHAFAPSFSRLPRSLPAKLRGAEPRGPSFLGDALCF